MVTLKPVTHLKDSRYNLRTAVFLKMFMMRLLGKNVLKNGVEKRKKHSLLAIEIGLYFYPKEAI
jgi:hypothetical protein